MPRRLAHFSDPRLDAQIGEIIKKHKELQKDIEQLERRLKKPIELPDAMPPTEHEHEVADITDFPDAMPPTAHDHEVADITNFPETMSPTAHKDTHAGGSDALTPADIGAAPAAYESAVEGFTPTTVAAALDNLAGLRIVDMGGDTNGTYVQWGNGLQVCWGQFSYALDPAKWTLGTSITFPAEFISKPSLFLGYNKSGWRIILTSASIDKASFRPSAYNFDSAVTSGDMWYLAIGMWKG